MEESTTGEAADNLRDLLANIFPFTVVAITMLMANRACKGMLPMALSGLLYVRLQQQGLPQPEAATSKKQEKKLQQQLKAARAASIASMKWDRVNPALLDMVEFTEDFDLLVLGCIMFTVNAAVAAAAKWLLCPSLSPANFSISLTVFVFVISLMYKVEWGHMAIQKADKLYMLVAGLLGAAVSFWLLLYAPRSLLDFDAAGASAELVGRVQALMESRLKAVASKLEVEVPQAPPAAPIAVGLPLALCGGLLSALLMAPGLRYGRVLQVLLKPPLWAHEFAGQAGLMRLVVQAAFVAQVLLLPLWITPLTDALFIPAHVVCYLRGASLLVVVVLQFLALRPLVQAFLFSAAYQAYMIHDMVDLDGRVKGRLLNRQFTMTLSQLSKAAMQLTFLPSLLLLCGCLHMLMSYPSPLAATHPKATEWDKQASVLYQTVAGFLGWWSCVSFVCWATLGVLMSRMSGIE